MVINETLIRGFARARWRERERERDPINYVTFNALNYI